MTVRCQIPDDEGAQCQAPAIWRAPVATTAGEVFVSYVCDDHKKLAEEFFRSKEGELPQGMAERILARFERI